MDTISFALLFIVVVLSILVLALGVQVFFILRELRQTVAKANKVLDDTGSITESVSGPISSFSQIASGVKTGVSIIQALKGKSGKKGSKNE